MQQTMQQRKFSLRRLRLGVLAFGLAALCAGFFARFARAQLTNGDVIGTVTDTSGAVIPGAKVPVRAEAPVLASLRCELQGTFWRYTAELIHSIPEIRKVTHDEETSRNICFLVCIVCIRSAKPDRSMDNPQQHCRERE